jgi:hypothetical protein
LLCAACFETPIDETVTLEFRADASVEIALSVQVASPIAAGQALLDRLDEERSALLEGRDAWTRRFERIEPAFERAEWEKEGGHLRRLARAAVVDDASTDLLRFFSDTEVTVFHERGERTTEFALYAGNAARADRRQREIVGRELGRHAERVAAHIEAAAALWDHLAGRPDRARVCLAPLFGELVPEEVRAGLDDPDEAEQALVDALETAMAEVAGILEAGGGEAYSLDELSRLVFDPFPARILVRVPEGIETVEGFEVLADGRLLVRPLGLWEAFLGLEGRWLAPDPLVALAAAWTREREGGVFDLDEFVSRERRVVSVPSAGEVADAIDDALRPAAAYRVVWENPAPEP